MARSLPLQRACAFCRCSARSTSSLRCGAPAKSIRGGRWGRPLFFCPGGVHVMIERKGALLKKGLSPARFERRFADSLREATWFHPGLQLGAAVSGGADSVALLTLLAAVRSQLGIVLSVVHFNHQLRGQASDADERFVSALAETRGLPLHAGRADVAAQARREK